jgi:histone H3/H4
MKMSEEINININNLYEERVFNDMTCGGIKVLYPVNIDGSADNSRNPIFIAVANIMSQHGAVPISAPIDNVKTLEEAAKNFRTAIDKMIEEMIRQAQQMAREERSRIITPSDITGNSGLNIIK